MRFILALLTTLLCINLANAQNGKLCYTTDGSNCVPAVQAAFSAKISIASATTTQIVALSAGKYIYVTSFELVSAGANTAKFVYGTGSACGTGTTDLTGAYTLATSSLVQKGSGLGGVLFVPAGNALCITTSGSPQLSGSVSYAQF